MDAISNGSPAKFIGGSPEYNGKTCTIADSYKSINTGGLRYKVRWDDPADREVLHTDIGADFLAPILVERLRVMDIAPAVGARVRAYDIPAFLPYEGQEVTVTEVGGFFAYAEFKSRQKPDDTVRLGFNSYEAVSEAVSEEATEPVAAETADDGRHAELQAKITQLEADNSRMSSSIYSYCEDINTIGTLLLEEAERRDWCEEYDEFVQHVNSRLLASCLHVREKEYTVEWTQNIIVSITKSVTVTAVDEESAEEMAREEDIEESDIYDSVSSGDWEPDVENYPDYCITEA